MAQTRDVTEKAKMLLALAMNEAAPEGEWHAAARALLAMARRGDVELYIGQDPEQVEVFDWLDFVMPWGKHAGKKLSEIAECDTGYTRWLGTQAEIRDRRVRKAVDLMAQDMGF